MAEENRHSFVEMADPFDSGKRIGAVKALNTDIAIVHALAADRYGNTIMSPVSQDTLWGSRSSRGGVVVTAEKIVTSDFYAGMLTWSVSRDTLSGRFPSALWAHTRKAVSPT
jgi:acyl CoA:acetate/3-ketoacid CoA transferase alpha subunit